MRFLDAVVVVQMALHVLLLRPLVTDANAAAGFSRQSGGGRKRTLRKIIALRVAAAFDVLACMASSSERGHVRLCVKCWTLP